MNYPILAPTDYRLANLCDSAIVGKLFALLPPDVACDREKMLSAAAVLTRIYGSVDINVFAELVRAQPLLIEGMAQLTQTGSNILLDGITTHADYFEGQIFVRQDYFITMVNYLSSRGIVLPVPDHVPEIEMNFWGEIGMWVSPVRLSLDDKNIVV